MDFPIDLERIANGDVTDTTIRSVLRYGLAREVARLQVGGPANHTARKRALIEQLRNGPVAVAQDAANSQHYEVSPAFFELCLGARRKYSGCFWGEGVSTLDEAELAMLQRTADSAQLEDGQRILELGCGWGSLTLYMAERYPSAQIVALSNSRAQRETIVRRAKAAGLTNVEVITADITSWPGVGTFDRIVSVEMLEHMRNYEVLFDRIASWMKPKALFFAHIFAHRDHAYLFEEGWTASRFFSGGTMPSVDLFSQFSRSLRLLNTWQIDGTHYGRTSEAWLQNLDANRAAALSVLGEGRSPEAASLELAEWRLFYLLTAESFAFNEGREWIVAHYLFEHAR